jgi:hypothetical protein
MTRFPRVSTRRPLRIRQRVLFFEEDGIASSFGNFISPDYIQHSPSILSGRNNTLTLLESNRGVLTAVNITILKIMFDSPYGMVHYK